LSSSDGINGAGDLPALCRHLDDAVIVASPGDKARPCAAIGRWVPGFCAGGGSVGKLDPDGGMVAGLFPAARARVDACGLQPLLRTVEEEMERRLGYLIISRFRSDAPPDNQ